MKLPKFFFALLILFVSFRLCPAQENNEASARLLDTLDAVNCEEIRGRTDNFLVTLKNEPGALGYIVFYAGEELIRSSFYERSLRGHIKQRRFPENRIKFVNAETGNEFKVEFWLSGNQAKPPIVEKPPSEVFKLSPKNDRYLFADDWINIGESEGKLDYFSESDCAIESVDFSLLAQYLEANPEINAEILVYNKKASRARRLIGLFLNEAGKEYKIPLNRLKINYAGADKKDSQPPDRRISTVKIWLVRQRKEEKR